MGRRKYLETKARIVEEFLKSTGNTLTASDLIEAMSEEVSKRDIYTLLNDSRYGLVGKAIEEKRERGDHKKYKKNYTLNISSYDGLVSILEVLLASKRYGHGIAKNLDFVFSLCYSSPYGDGISFDLEDPTDFRIEIKRSGIEPLYEWNLGHPEEKQNNLENILDDGLIQLTLARAKERKGIETLNDKLAYIVAYFERDIVKALHIGLGKMAVSDSEYYEEWDRTYEDYLKESKKMNSESQKFFLGLVKLSESSIEYKIKKRKFNQWFYAKIERPLYDLTLEELSLASIDSKIIDGKSKNSNQETIELCFDLIVKQALNNCPDPRLLGRGTGNFDWPTRGASYLLKRMKNSPINELEFDSETLEILSAAGEEFEPIKTEILKFVHGFGYDYKDFDSDLRRKLTVTLKKINSPPKGHIGDREALERIAARIAKIKEVSVARSTNESVKQHRFSQYLMEDLEEIISRDMDRRQSKDQPIE